jgi:hypothetical protein
MALVDRLALEKKCLAIAYNLTCDLFMEQSMHLEDPVPLKNSFTNRLNYYEQAMERAPDCVETASAYGGALIALKLLDSAEIVLQRGIVIKDVDGVYTFLSHIGITLDADMKDQLIALVRLRIKDLHT